MNQAERIADQLHRSFLGEPWHGPSVSQALENVSAETAAAHPIPGGHSIWELVEHLRAWMVEVNQTVLGKQYESLKGDRDWPAVVETRDEAWRKAQLELANAASRLVESVQKLGADTELHYEILHGIAQHNAYHAGQMALLKKLGPKRQPLLRRRAESRCVAAPMVLARWRRVPGCIQFSTVSASGTPQPP